MSSSAATDVTAIRARIAAWAHAIDAKDLDGITAQYTPATVLFDAIPPYRTVGRDAIRRIWSACLPFFPARFTTELRDVTVQVAGELAWAHFLLHFDPVPADDPSGQTWMRCTVAYRRQGDAWMVEHEHVSVPFNPLNNQAWFIRDPAVADAPDYGSAPGATPGAST